jgi:NAD(P)-dependent dehydrogenase (short-subunit alcohol dehydrogenase family)
MTEFENRIAIVTGTTGIGSAIAKRLAFGLRCIISA